MRRLIIAFVLICSVVFSKDYDINILKIESFIAPKLFLMDLDYSEKLIDNKIGILIFYDTGDKHIANSLKKMIEKKYKNTILSFGIKVEILNYKDFNHQKASMYFLLNSSEKNIEKITSFANNKQILTFAYDSIFLKNGVSFSLAIDKTAKPFANLKTLKSSGIRLRPVVLRISKAYVK